MGEAEQSRLHPGLYIGASTIEGRGWFTRRDIPAGETVARFSGTVVTDVELAALLRRRDADASLPYVDTIVLDDGLNLVLPPGTPLHYGNHSCDPSAWWTDAVTLVARRDILPGEEVTSDYGTSSGDPNWSMTCNCRSPLCRSRITGEDWQRPELQRRYGQHWVPVLLRRIETMADEGPG